MLMSWQRTSNEKTKKMDAVKQVVTAFNIEFEGAGEHDRFIIETEHQCNALFAEWRRAKSVQFFCPPPVVKSSHKSIFCILVVLAAVRIDGRHGGRKEGRQKCRQLSPAQPSTSMTVVTDS